jgi:hypothetical protein
MDYLKMQNGWRRAARKFMARRPVPSVKLLTLTAEQAAEMAATQARINQRKKTDRRLGYGDSLVGKVYGWLLVWERLQTETNGMTSRYVVLCACGEPTEASTNGLLKSRARHCGCMKSERHRVTMFRRKQARKEEREDRKRVQAVLAVRKRKPEKKYFGMAA